jgi:hypothetical protein
MVWVGLGTRAVAVVGAVVVEVVVVIVEAEDGTAALGGDFTV